MNKTDKIIIIFFVFLIVSYTSGIIYTSNLYKDIKFPKENRKPLDEIEFTKTIDVNKTRIFYVMSNLQNYPLVLPENILSTTILNQSNNVVYAEEEVMETSIKTKLMIKQVIIPLKEQTLEILNGDAKGTKITETFEEHGSNTTITINVKLHLEGKLSPFLYISKPILENQLDKSIKSFADYARGFDNEYEKKVDDLYRQILYRPADETGLKYYSSLLQSGKMTIDDIKKSLSESNEAKYILKPSERKTVDELNQTTKESIDDLYLKILYRHADIKGLQNYGSLLESGKMTIDDIKKSLLKSDEEKYVLAPNENLSIDELNNTTRKNIDDLYQTILHRPADPEGLRYYGSLLQAGKLTLDDVKKSIYDSQESLNIRLANPTKKALDDLFMDTLGRHATEKELEYYAPRVGDSITIRAGYANMTWDQIKMEILSKK